MVKIIVDSGATDHMVNDRRVLKDCWAVDPITITTAKDGEMVVGRKRGVLKLKSVLKEPIKKYQIYDVLFVPNLHFNLLSVSKLVSTGKTVHFDHSEVVILDLDDDVVARGKRVGGLYVLEFIVDDDDDDENFNVKYSDQALMSKVENTAEIWHKRFGHLNMGYLQRLLRHDMVEGCKLQPSQIKGKLGVCKSCALGKQARQPFKKNKNKARRPLEVIHSDVCGPMSEDTYDGFKYFVLFIDDFTHFAVVYLMKFKSEVLEKFREFEAMASAHFNVQISKLRSDNGGEYMGKDFSEFCKNKGIQMTQTCPYTPQQNGMCERMNRTLVEKAKAMLTEHDVPLKFWGEAIYVATYLTNRAPTSSLKCDKTPYEMWFDRKPDISGLRVFGCTAFVQVSREKRRKFDDKSKVMVFLGYANNGYRLWDREQRRIKISRDVLFDEHLSPFTNNRTLPTKVTSKHFHKQKSQSEAEDSYLDSDEEDDDDQYESLESNTESSEDDDSEDDAITVHDSDEEQDDHVGEETPTIRRSERIYDQWVEKYDQGGGAMSVSSMVDDIPQSIEQLKNRDDWPQWKRAIEEELESLNENRTWTVVNGTPKGFKAINSMWLFSIKDSESIPRYKARLVAKGCSQRYGFDYHETFAPVAKMTSVRTILSISVVKGMLVHQMDVKTAFLNGKLKEEVYMKLPTDESGERRICRLNRSIYGLKQASRSWNQRFDEVVKKLGFNRLLSDTCVYVSYDKALYIVLYVDDILIVGVESIKIEKVKHLLSEKFQMKDLGPVKTFLGLEIERDFVSQQMKISQKSYIL